MKKVEEQALNTKKELKEKLDKERLFSEQARLIDLLARGKAEYEQARNNKQLHELRSQKDERIALREKKSKEYIELENSVKSLKEKLSEINYEIAQIDKEIESRRKSNISIKNKPIHYTKEYALFWNIVRYPAKYFSGEYPEYFRLSYYMMDQWTGAQWIWRNIFLQ